MEVIQINLVTQELIPEAVWDLKKLITRTKADVVIISDWRYGALPFREKAYKRGYERNIINWDNLIETFKKEGISITDVTPWDDNIANRTTEIKTYLETHPEIKRYAILDDCFGDSYESDKEIQSHLVFVDALKGLQKENLLSVCAIMNRQKSKKIK